MRLETKVLFDLRVDVLDLFDRGKLVDGLGVVGHRSVGVDGDGHRAHAQEAERHEAEGKHGRGDHDVAETLGADDVADAHEDHDGEADVVATEVTRDETGEDVERRPALPGRGDHFLDVGRLGGGEDLHQFRDESSGQRTHADDDREHPLYPPNDLCRRH